MLVGYIDRGKNTKINKKQQNPSIGRGRVSYTDTSQEEEKKHSLFSSYNLCTDHHQSYPHALQIHKPLKCL